MLARAASWQRNNNYAARILRIKRKHYNTIRAKKKEEIHIDKPQFVRCAVCCYAIIVRRVQSRVDASSMQRMMMGKYVAVSVILRLFAQHNSIYYLTKYLCTNVCIGYI